MNKLLIICGPTATGKTKLGIDLAKKFNGEIISADSRQVYRGMDIGTGKDDLRTWLIDVAKPDFRFNVADYKKYADIAIEDILSRNKLPIIVGGTGFYIKAVTEGIETIGVEPDWELRAKLANYRINELRIVLEKIDPKRWQKMNESDRQNPRRLVRAIEIAQNKKQNTKYLPCSPRGVAGRPAGKIQNTKKDTLFIGLTSPYKFLYQRIDRRVEARVEAGLEEEIRSLLKKGYTWENSALGTTLAYNEWRPYFENQKNKEEVIKKWKFDEHGYARRQMTWFRKQPKINWFDINKQNFQEEVEKKVGNWYS